MDDNTIHNKASKKQFKPLSNFKKVSINKNTFNSIINVLELINSSEINSKCLSCKSNNNDNINTLNNSIVNREISFVIFSSTEAVILKENLINSISNLKNEIILYKKNSVELTNYYEESIKENKKLLNTLEQLNHEKNEVKNKYNTLKKNYDNLKEELSEINQNNTVLNKTISKYKKLFTGYSANKNNNNIEESKDITNKLENEKSQNDLNSKKISIIDILKDKQVLSYTIKYLDIKDLINLKNSNSIIKNNVINSCNMDKTVSLIKEYFNKLNINKKSFVIKTLAKDCYEESKIMDAKIKKNYSEIEKLFNSYFNNKKIPGKNLKNQVLICLNFLEKDVKIPLGISLPVNNEQTINKQINIDLNNNSTTIQKKDLISNPNTNEESKSVNQLGSFFDSIKTFISKNTLNNAKEEQSNQTNNENNISTVTNVSSKLSSTFTSLNNNSKNRKSNIYDYSIENNYLINHLKQLNLDFDYIKPEEIKILIDKVYKENFTVDFLKEFENEFANQFSNLLFYSNEALKEIKEIDYLKDLVNNRYKAYYKSFHELENEMEDLRKYNATHKEIKEILSNQKTDLEIRYSSCKTEITIQQQQIDQYKQEKNKIVNLLEKKKNENEFLKNKLISEFAKYKKELELSKQENIEIVNNLLEFRRYVFRFNITEDGEVLFNDN